jgi:hypothetical protein
MATKQTQGSAPTQKGPSKGNPGKTNQDMKTMGRNLAKVAAQKRGG